MNGIRFDLETDHNQLEAILKKWCDNNLLVPHPDKCKAMIMQRQPFIGPIQALRLANSTINWTTSERLLGVLVNCYNKMTWSDHVANVAKSFASTESTSTHAVPPPKAIGRLLYKSYIATCGLVVWGSCNKAHFSNLEIFQARAGRIMYGLHVSWDASTADVLMQTRWDSLERMYKVRLAEFTFKCVKGL